MKPQQHPSNLHTWTAALIALWVSMPTTALAADLPAESPAALSAPPPPPQTPPVHAPRGSPEASIDLEAAPRGYHWESQRRKGLLTSGLVLLGVGYTGAAAYSLAILTGRFKTDASTYVLLVPVIGPLISQAMFSSCDRCGGSFFGNADPFRWILTIVSSVLQLPGALMAFKGFGQTRELVRDPDECAQSTPGKLQWAIAPGAPGALLGVSLSFSN